MKGKTQKGITLVALIITIVVLLILATVAINSIVNTDLIAHAENAAGKYNNAVTNEQTMLNEYLNHLNNGINGSGSGDGEQGGSGSVDTVVTVTPKVGQYVEYDVSYTDMYQGTAVYDNSEEGKYGWRYLGTETDADGKIKNHLLVSTAIPMKLYYHYSIAGGNAKWWDTDETLKANVRATNGMLKNFDRIPFAQKASGTSMSSGEENTAIGDFAESKRKHNGVEYDAVGDYFKVTGKSYSDEITVRALTREDLEKANGGTSSGLYKLEGDALGLFNLQDLTGYTAFYYYWLASPHASYADGVYYVDWNGCCVLYNSNNNLGVRPVVVLPSDIQFTNVDNNNVLEIKEN